MKFLLLFFFLVPGFAGFAQTEAERIESDFKETQAIVESNRFKVVFTIATPLSGLNVRVDTAWLIIDGPEASGYLPYYTARYGYAMTGNKGIVFDNEMFARTEKVKGRNVRKAIKYTFGIVGKNDIYRMQMDIQYDRTCYLYVTSNQRSPISYVGTVYKLASGE